jgi:hypothetical protein
VVIHPADALLQNSAHYMSYQGPLGIVYMQEIASSEPRELKKNTGTSELLPRGLGDSASWLICDTSTNDNTSPYKNSIVTEPSLHVQAQRLRELEWLKIKEIKL